MAFGIWDIELPLSTKWTITLLVLLAYPALTATYNAYFHPLSKIPGPRTWASSRLPFIRALLNGTVVHDIEKLHRRYGPVLRIAPDEVTFASSDAWSGILRSHPQFLKDPVWWSPQPGFHDSLGSIIPPQPHARIRKLVAPGFTPQALKGQEPIIHQYVDLLIDRMREFATREEGQRVVNIGPWFQFTTFDIFGDLGFGESFQCLQDSQYHPWIAMLFNSEKTACYIAAARFYPLLTYLLLKCVPPSLKKMQLDHHKQIADKVDRRLSLQLERPDIMSHVIQESKSAEGGLPLGTIHSTFVDLTTAGSETTATALTGTLNYLVQNPDKLNLLEQEIRRFSDKDQITFDALKELQYLNAVLKEGLRLCPPIPWIVSRRVPKGGATVCGAWLPEGTAVSIQAYTMNRDPDYFHKPTDFLPERWLPDETTNSSSPFFHDNRQAVQPFTVGPRSCLGQNIAWAEMRLIMAKLLWTFDLSVGPETVKWEDLRTFLLVEKKPIEVKIALRGEP